MRNYEFGLCKMDFAAMINGGEVEESTEGEQHFHARIQEEVAANIDGEEFQSTIQGEVEEITEREEFQTRIKNEVEASVEEGIFQDKDLETREDQTTYWVPGEEKTAYVILGEEGNAYTALGGSYSAVHIEKTVIHSTQTALQNTNTTVQRMGTVLRKTYAAIQSADIALQSTSMCRDGQEENRVPVAGMVSLQSLPQVASLAAGLQGMAGLGTQLINTPLNLSASATNNLPNPGAPGHAVGGLLGPAPQPQLLTAPQPAAMPQFILASGQLVQGIQGAQLLIPTSQGIATQTILTIPVNHVTSSQMVNLALSNGQVVTTTLANLQTLAQPHHLLAPASAPNTVPSPSGGGLGLSHGHGAGLPPHLLGSGAAQQHQQLLNAMQQSQLVTPPPAPAHPPPQRPLHQHHNHNHNHHYPVHEKHHSNGSMNGSESSMSAISRLAASNTDITITSTHPSPQNLQKPSPIHASSNGLSHHHRSSPPVDFLADSPNQPTINQTNSNVVDGINLDEIKEFAKAFKLRRLSLGLTQTQVGQALSITEGPAYSQSAICSALATQMYCAAQIASQHQNMFEKLDITPKSAQKIKPVLEMWMKEAEERYKSGQNQLTEFIGVEPSKKRKRRTSFTPQALELLNAHFERNTHPSGTEITALAHQLGYEREVIRIWFCNKRQALKNTVRMMSKGVGVA